MSTSKLEWTDLDKRAVDTVRALAMDSVQKVGQRPSRHRDEPRAGRLPALPAVPAARPDRPALGGAGPVRALRRALQPHALHPALPVRLRARARRPQAAAHLGLADPRSPRARAHRRASRPPPARSGRASATPSAWRWRPVASAACSTRTRLRARASSTTTCGASPPTATSRRACPARPRHSPATQRLGNLTLIYDDNHISIEDDTVIALSEDVAGPLRGYGWHVQEVDWLSGSGKYVENVQALADAFDAARADTDRPSFISLRTVIAWPAPNAQNTGKAHGSALGRRRGRRDEEGPGHRPGPDLRRRPRGARPRPRGRGARAGPARRLGRAVRRLGRRPTRSGRPCCDRMSTRTLPEGWTEALPDFPADPKGMATRKASGNVLEAIAPVLPELWGGSADLAESQQHHDRRASRRSCRRTASPRSSPAARTAGCCTSASASTRWARS